MAINIWDLLVLAGVAQGFILGTIILNKPSNKPKSNQLMASLLFIFSLASLGLFIENEMLFETSSVLYFIHKYFPFLYISLVGPIIYLFIKGELIPNYTFGAKDKIHFYLILWSFIPTFLAIGRDVGSVVLEADNNLYAITKNIQGGFKRYGDVILWLVTTSYLVASLGVYNKFKGSPRSIWIRQFLNIFIFFQFVIWLPFLLVYISPFHFMIPNSGLSYYFIYGPLILIIYWISIKWLTGAPTLTFKSRAKEQLEKNLPEEIVRSCVEDLNHIMGESKLYLNKNLTVNDLSKAMNTSTSTIVYVLHQEIGKTFNEFVDGFRVLASIEKITSEDFEKGALAQISENCGFKSLDEFKRVFKQHTDLLPQQYLKNQIKTSKEPA